MERNQIWNFGVLCFFVATYLADASSNLFVVSPNLLRVNSDEDVWVTLHHDQNIQTAVKVYLETYPDRGHRFSKRKILIGKDESKKVSVRVGWSDIPRGSQLTYVYLVAECAAQRFRKEFIVLLSKKSGYVFLQTDKPIYNPHETVHVRVVSLNSEMKPSNTTFNIDIINPNGDIIRRFENKRATTGFVQEDFPLPKISVHGNWTIQASYQDMLQPETTKTSIQFEVKEYELPTFSVGVDVLDDYILSSQAEIQFKVTANYVFGTPVKGRGSATFYLVTPDGIELYIGFRPIDELDQHVEAITKHEFGPNWFPSPGTRLLVRLTVTEEATGKQERAADSSAVFVRSPFVISYERMPKFYKPGLPFIIKVDVTHPNQAVASGVPVIIEAVVTVDGRKRKVYHNRRRSEDIRTDGNGRVDLTVNVPTNAEDLKITVTTDDTMFPEIHQATKEIMLQGHNSSSGEFMFLQLARTGSRVLINSDLEIRVDFTDIGSKKVNFLVVARGKILQHFIQGVSGRSARVLVTISPIMSPQARVIAYYPSGLNVIADSMVLDIVQACGSELTITANGKKSEYSPKDNVQLTVNAGAGSTVSLLGVDKAVYLLSEKDILTRSKMFKKMLEMDIGCGPGGGKDTADVFKQAGVGILVKSSNVNTPRRNFEKCSQTSLRKRRDVLETVRDIMARLDEQDQTCCNHGVEDSIDTLQSCRLLGRNFGLRRRSCVMAFQQCCEAERRVVETSRGRSNLDVPLMQFEPSPLVEADVEIDERRSDFRQTWINDLFTLDPNKASTTLLKTLPDSITTWVISGVSVTPDKGMCVAVPTNITARKRFFLHVDLPYSAVRTEQLQVKATVYNLGDRSLRVHVSLKADESICYAAEQGKYTYRQEIFVEKESAKSVTFPIVPLKANDQPSEISVKAVSAFEGDEVVKKLRIRNEGEKKVIAETFRVDPEGIMGDTGSGALNWNVQIYPQDRSQTMKIPLKFPDDAIPGTETCSVRVQGNILGTSTPQAADLDLTSFIQKSTGSGEENIMALGQLVSATKYLLLTGKLTVQQEEVATENMVTRFESQLAFKKANGMYSAWQYSSPSTWLTAFATKVFCQATIFGPMDGRVKEHVIAAVNALISTQTRIGNFMDQQDPMNRDMMVESKANNLTMTAFVVECLASCKNAIDLSSRGYVQSMRRAVEYLTRYRHTSHSPYTQAIVAYALALMDSPDRFQANQMLRGSSQFDIVTGMRYWTIDGQTTSDDTPSWYREKPSPAAIETASYALLTQLALSNQESYFSYSGPIASWLMRQRKTGGTFTSTMDSVLGLEALGEYAIGASSREQSPLDMQLTLFASGRNFGLNKNINLTEDNGLRPVLIEKNLPIGGDLMVEVTGSGLAQLQVECVYNAPPRDGKNCLFTLDVESTEYKATSADLGPLDDPLPPEDDRSRFGRSVDGSGASKFVARIQSRIRYNGPKNVGMTILEVSLFTGFEPYLDDLKKLTKDGIVYQYEITGSSVLFYLKGISNTEDTSVTFRATQKYKVGKTQPVVVTVYDYYAQNSEKCTKFYHPQAGGALLAQSCEDSRGRQVCACVAGTCSEYWGFDRNHLPRGRRFNVKNRYVLYQEACEVYDYVVKVRAGQTFVNKPVVEMQAVIEHVLKLGSDNFDTREMINFVWNSECVYPVMSNGVSYLVMGKNGKQYIDQNGRPKTKYILDSSSHVIQWYGREKPGYNNALNNFAGRLLRRGCS